MIAGMNSRRTRFSNRFARLALAAALIVPSVLAPSTALAQDEEENPFDVRYRNFVGPDNNFVAVYNESDSRALQWILLGFLGLLCCGVMFKDARRTHLD